MKCAWGTIFLLINAPYPYIGCTHLLYRMEQDPRYFRHCIKSSSSQEKKETLGNGFFSQKQCKWSYFWQFKNFQRLSVFFIRPYSCQLCRADELLQIKKPVVFLKETCVSFSPLTLSDIATIILVLLSNPQGPTVFFPQGPTRRTHVFYRWILQAKTIWFDIEARKYSRLVIILLRFCLEETARKLVI